jgi:hypothetical protein
MCGQIIFIRGGKLCARDADSTCFVNCENLGVSPATVGLLLSQGLSWNLLDLTSFAELVKIGISEDDATLLKPDLQAKYFAL